MMTLIDLLYSVGENKCTMKQFGIFLIISYSLIKRFRIKIQFINIFWNDPNDQSVDLPFSIFGSDIIVTLRLSIIQIFGLFSSSKFRLILCDNINTFLIINFLILFNALISYLTFMCTYLFFSVNISKPKRSPIRRSSRRRLLCLFSFDYSFSSLLDCGCRHTQFLEWLLWWYLARIWPYACR